jgi:hypothetical protein
MPYVMDSGSYSPVGDYTTVPGMDVVGTPPELLSGWPSYQPTTGWFARRYGTAPQPKGGLKGGGGLKGLGVLSGVADFFGALKDDVKAAFGPPSPTVVGRDGKVYGTAKPPRGNTPGVLKPATGKMTVRDPQGRMWSCTVVNGAVTAAAPAPASARPTVVPAVPVPAPGAPPVRVVVPSRPVSPPAVIGRTPIATTPVASTPIAVTAMAATVTGTTRAVPAPAPTTVPGTTCPPCGTTATAPVAVALPARGIYGGRLPTATQFLGRPIGASATTSVAAIPVAPTLQTPTGSWANVVRAPTGVRPTYQPRRLNPVFMANY